MSKFMMKRLEARIPHGGEVVLAPCLVAADEQGVAALGRIKSGEYVTCEVRKPRNTKFSRKYHALIQLIYDTLPEASAAHYSTIDSFKGAIKWELGVRKVFVKPGGEIAEQPGSISFGEMDEIEFAGFYDRAVALICTRIIPGMDSESLKAEVLDLIGG